MSHYLYDDLFKKARSLQEVDGCRLICDLVNHYRVTRTSVDLVGGCSCSGLKHPNQSATASPRYETLDIDPEFFKDNLKGITVWVKVAEGYDHDQEYYHTLTHTVVELLNRQHISSIWHTLQPVPSDGDGGAA